METLKNKQVLVVGLARTGLAVAAFLRARGARVTITDQLPAAALGPAVDQAARLGCTLALAGHPVEVFTAADLVVISPGVPLGLPQLAAAGARRIPVIGELELASRYLRLPIVAVSGTNGKTTTTALIGDMCTRGGLRTFVGGNIGNPLISLLLEKQTPEVAVVEVSSFQLDSMQTFHPRVAVLLNITEDHLDRYDSFAGYAASKCRLFVNQTEEDVAVLPADDPVVMQRCAVSSRRFLFSRKLASAQAYLRGKRLICQAIPGSPHRYDLSHWQLTGIHNQENLLAAVIAATCMGVRPAAIQESINTFRGLAHRLELIHQWRGISFFDDSKGTNVGSVVRSLESVKAPVILIAGGRDKEGSYAPLAPLIRERVKVLVLMGEARFRLAKALAALTCTVVVDTMKAAVSEALCAAVPGDVVLLSPACSSFDLYENYAARGEHFRSLVYALTAWKESTSSDHRNPWPTPATRGLDVGGGKCSEGHGRWE